MIIQLPVALHPAIKEESAVEFIMVFGWQRSVIHDARYFSWRGSHLSKDYTTLPTKSSVGGPGCLFSRSDLFQDKILADLLSLMTGTEM